MAVTATAAAAIIGTGAGIVQADDTARRQKHAAERQAELIKEEAARTMAEAQATAQQAAQAAQLDAARQQALDEAEADRKAQEATNGDAQVVVDIATPASTESTAKRRARFQIADTPETSVRI